MNYKRKKKLLRIAPWAALVLGALLTNIGLLSYVSLVGKESRAGNEIFLAQVTLSTLDVPQKGERTYLAASVVENTNNIKPNIIRYYNSKYFSDLQNFENYSSLFEDLYQVHMRRVMNERMGIEFVNSVESAALLNNNLNESTPRKERVATKVNALERLYLSDLMLRRGVLKKSDGTKVFSKEFDKVLDFLFDVFRPVKAHSIFIPFKKPLYYVPYNYPLDKDGNKVKPIYTDTNSFTTNDLFTDENLESIGNLIKTITGVDQYVNTYNADPKNSENEITSMKDFLIHLHDKYSIIIDKLLDGILRTDILINEELFKGEAYISLSSNTFDQRLRSYSGTAVTSFTTQGLMNSFLAVDGLKYNNNNLAIEDQICSSENPNTTLNQLPTYNFPSSNSAAENANLFISSLTQQVTISGSNVRRLTNCFIAIPFTSRFSNEIMIVSTSNYGIQFIVPRGLDEELRKSNPKLKSLFKKNLLSELLTCNNTDGTEAACEKAIATLVPAITKLKYYPLLFTNFFDSVNIFTNEARTYLVNYVDNVKTSFNNYGIDIFKQSISFAAFETNAATSVPLEFNLNKFIEKDRWK